MGYNETRNKFFEEIGKIIDTEDIYIVSADLAGPPFDYIRERYPKRYVSVGIAEQNMISVSIGLALAGKKVIAYAANPFIALRSLDQIRNGICINKTAVAVVGLGTGFSVSSCGATHFVTEDIAIMKLCPGIKQITVNDNDISDAALNYMLHNNCALYLRFDKDCGGNLSEIDKKDIDINKGFRVLNKNNGNISIVAEGYPVHVIKEKYKDTENAPEIIEIFSHPFDKIEFVEKVKDKKRIVVCEEQQVVGGMGTEVLETINDFDLNIKVVRMGIDYKDKFPGCYGSRKFWFKYYGIDEEKLDEKINI